MSMIHPSACIEPGAILGENVQVGPFAVIESGAVVGPGSHIRCHAVIRRYARLGARCDVHPGAVIGAEPQDLSFNPADESFVEIGDGTVVREGASIHRGTKPGTVTRIGQDCLIMGNAHLAHNVQMGNRVIMVNGGLLAGYVDVADQVFISGNVTVHQFVRIGRLAMLSGLSALTMDLPPFCVLHNTESNVVSGLNIVGMRRAGIPSDERAAVKTMYRHFYLEGRNIRQALAELEGKPLTPLQTLFRDFVASAKRGIARPRFSADHTTEPSE